MYDFTVRISLIDYGNNIFFILDTCLSKPIGHSYPIDDLCSGYISCIAGRSYRACCDVNQRWISGSGCVFDPSCADACDREDSSRLVHPHGEYDLLHLIDTVTYVRS